MSINPTPLAPLAHLRRPKLLISAARFGLTSYERCHTLPRLLGGPVPPPGRAVLDILMMREDRMNAARSAAETGYSVAAHVDLLTALMAEADLYASTRIRAV
ncbi:hypothetical protein PARPLA_03076 [Rhodobacteraceae bacterium THAF1]|uniref:DUF6477 family protein n=1 Tax=Palleronia sp. THAF1 TaxID=2587842 RepID=UPI000F3F768F|nr:DUF6477 family protein [Palleronia sp. THAF1]QFU08475.1 hypothetical protein FIU81_07290 [Palleronia sp. THAF1]VDC29402.1 hypothetical protein PARPLA_03076 [Rhodobacteraceae bacterium THAF1]